MKNRLVKDKELMVAGSTAYTNNTNTLIGNTAQNQATVYNTNVINYNIDYVKFGSPFFVREKGVYIIFFVSSTNTSAQFTIFVNNVLQNYSTIGSNAGAGQVISRQMLYLNKNDNVVIRNYITASGDIIASGGGGTNVGNSETCVMMKIATNCNIKKSTKKACKKLMKCLHHSKQKLFHNLKEKLECDDELMMKGFNITGTFFTKAGQTVALEGDVIFDTNSNVNGLTWNPMSPTQITIQEDGIYKLFFVLNTNTACQFAMTVNGVAIETTTQGTNKGAGQLSSRALLTLRKNDIVTIRNHSSLLGPIVISTNAGGLEPTVDIIYTIFKIAPICKPTCEKLSYHLEKRLKCLYTKFKQYLLCDDKLQITGSPSYLSLSNTVYQLVNQNNPFYFSHTIVKKHMEYMPGGTDIVVKENGLYDVFVDIATNEPLQLALSINGVINPYTIFGRDSGANRVIIRQFVLLKRGDVVRIMNLSTSEVTTTQNAGGNYIGNNCMFMLFKLHNLCK